MLGDDTYHFPHFCGQCKSHDHSCVHRIRMYHPSGITSHMTKPEVTGMGGGGIILSQGWAVNHVSCWLSRRAVMMH